MNPAHGGRVPAREFADESGEETETTRGSRSRRGPAIRSGLPVFAVFWLIALLLTFAPAAPWHGWRGILLLAAGVTIIVRPPPVQISKTAGWLAAAFMLLACMVYLPADWFGIPAWREALSQTGLALPASVTVHPLLTAASLAAIAVGLMIMVYLTGHRVDHGGNHLLALLFTGGVAVLALFCMGAREYHWAVPWNAKDNYNFGFFLNRNHMATLLVMGTMAGAGVAIQSLRVRTWGSGVAALLSMAVCIVGVLAYSPSRAGVSLLTGFFVVWLLTLGREYLRGPAMFAAVTIAVSAMLFFLSRESAVKKRLQETAGQLSALAGGANGEEAAAAKEAGAPLDLRLPIYLDTLDMLRHEPWTGVGAGQFQYVFPQYRSRSAIVNDHQSLHPENDWLLMAAEAGLPATLALAALVLTTGGSALRAAMHGRARALRTGCLMAAAVVPVHGLFDVPGHRFELAVPACWLLAITLRGTRDLRPASRFSRVAFRGMGAAVVAAGGFLIYAQWLGGPVPAPLVAAQSVEKAGVLHTQELAAIKARDASPAEDQPGDDRMQVAVDVLNDALQVVPLDAWLHYLKGSFLLHFDGTDAQVDREFAIARILDPAWVAMPLIQGTAWARIDQARAEFLWSDALRRAEALEAIDPATTSGRANTFFRIMHDAALFRGMAAHAIHAARSDWKLVDDWASRAPRQELDELMPEVLIPELPEDRRQTLFNAWLERGSPDRIVEYGRRLEANAPPPEPPPPDAPPDPKEPEPPQTPQPQ